MSCCIDSGRAKSSKSRDAGKGCSSSCSDSGQAAVEAAFLLPLILIVMLLLLQPTIFLYNRAVMNAAASEGCRLLATAPSARNQGEKHIGFIKRRLGAVPPLDIFHVHAPCSWAITFEGDESSSEVSVKIENKIKPVPLVGSLWSVGLDRDGSGYIKQTVEVSSKALPLWASPATPSDWGLR